MCARVGSWLSGLSRSASLHLFLTNPCLCLAAFLDSLRLSASICCNFVIWMWPRVRSGVCMQGLRLVSPVLWLLTKSFCCCVCSETYTVMMQSFGIPRFVVLMHKVEFLTSLVVFWQHERRRRREAARLALLPPPAASPKSVIAPIGNPTSVPDSAHVRASGKRRSESELLNDARRRPPQPSASSTAQQQQQQLTSTTSQAVSARGFRTSAMVNEIKAAAQQHAQQKGAGTQRLTRGAISEQTAAASASAAAAPSAKELAHLKRSTAAAIDRTIDEQWPGDDNNFSMSGVTLMDGEIVLPTLHVTAATGTASARHAANAASTDVDLFVLYELVSRRYGGYASISKRQWIEVMRRMASTTRIMEKHGLFQSNQNDRDEPDNASNTSPTKRSQAQTKADEQAVPSQAMADELREVYRVHLLLYEEYVTRHRKELRQKMEGADGDDVDMADEGTNAAGGGDHFANPVAGSTGLPMPAPAFSMAEIKRWALIRARKQHQATLHCPTEAQPATAAASSSAAAPAAASTRTRRSVASSSKSSHAANEQSLCSQCKQDTLAPMCQCYHCQTSK